MITDLELGWLIGIIDGEGSFDLYKDKKQLKPRFSLANTNELITNKLTNILDKLCIDWTHSTRSETLKHNKCKIIAVRSCDHLRKLLDVILPHMECRFEQAWCLSEFVNLRLTRENWQTGCGPEEYVLYSLLKQENHK